MFVTVTADRLLLFHDKQHPAGPPEPDVWCSCVPVRRDIAHTPNYPRLCHHTRALRSKVRTLKISHPGHQPLTRVLVGSANAVHTTGPLSSFQTSLPNSSGIPESLSSASWCGTILWASSAMQDGPAPFTPGALLSSWSSGPLSSSVAPLLMLSLPVLLLLKQLLLWETSWAS